MLKLDLVTIIKAWMSADTQSACMIVNIPVAIIIIIILLNLGSMCQWANGI